MCPATLQKPRPQKNRALTRDEKYPIMNTGLYPLRDAEYSACVDPMDLPIEILVSPSFLKGDGEPMSQVAGKQTTNGGSLVDQVYEQIVRLLTERLWTRART